MRNETNASPAQSIHELSVKLNNGRELPLSEFKGRKLLLVNTASNCGYTGQYDALQQLHTTYGDKLAVIGFPSNDFAEQEKGSDQEIEEFCRINFGVTFPLAAKSGVLKNEAQQPIFKWLTDKNANGWNDSAPGWNFTKYVIDENGKLEAFFEAGVTPDSPEVLKLIES